MRVSVICRIARSGSSLVPPGLKNPAIPHIKPYQPVF
jgi:hypothetical protein